MSVNTFLPSQRGELYKQTISKMRNHTVDPSGDCPLNSPNIGLISENDHRVRMCLCPICTCGKHICPSKAIQDPYPTSIFASQYMSNFQMRTPQTVKIPHNRGNFLPSVAFDFETSNEEAYKPQNVSAVIAATAIQKNVPLVPPKSAFYAKSSYSNNFLNWGTGANVVVKPDQAKHTTDEIKMIVKTSYRDNYSPIGKEQAISARPETVKKGKNTHIDPKAVFSKVTSNRKDFLDYSRVYDKEPGYKQYSLIPRMKSVDSHYVTTAKGDYRDLTNGPDHRMLRKAMEKEGLLP